MIGVFTKLSEPVFCYILRYMDMLYNSFILPWSNLYLILQNVLHVASLLWASEKDLLILFD